MIEIEHFEKLLTLLKTFEDDQNININIQRKPWSLNGSTWQVRKISISIVNRKMYRYFSHHHNKVAFSSKKQRELSCAPNNKNHYKQKKCYHSYI